jgi:hypothetical protein
MANRAVVNGEEETAVKSVSRSSNFNPLNHPIIFTYPSRIAISAWIAHVPFGMYLIDVLRPNALVELGAHYGVSYCAFCQAVKELGLDTRCYAIDSWKGDAQSGFYGREVLADLEEHHNPVYGGFSRLVQSTFDEALGYFPDHTFDLLHLDGFHTYEEAKKDFDNWLPKMTDRGVVIIHDINVREREFGVWKLWEELKPRFPHFEFVHSHGLGVLAVGNYPDELNELFQCSAEEAIRIRTCFASLGARLEVAKELQLSKAESSQLLLDMQRQLDEREQQIRTRDFRIQDMDQCATTMDQSLRTKDEQLQELEGQIRIHIKSPSFRLGRALTWPLRSIKSLFG